MQRDEWRAHNYTTWNTNGSLLVQTATMHCCYIFLVGVVTFAFADDDYNQQAEKEATESMLRTLWTSILVAVVLVLLFEANRRLKPIFLKRYREKFRISHRVPPPPTALFSWIITVWRVSDAEFLRMVGLDGWMYVRYIVVCFKVSCFLLFVGFLVLLPVYAAAGGDSAAWTKYTVANIPDKGAGQFWVT